ncbi:hypothetical protein [Bifidobacterium miconisargentati]|uniref:hypothetical protein n=1 Tax=Bifidobacterium miconisargentati TaxID=2834437 RepID=UPI001BDD8468|nr:hypothetical protein [Bifidobacterium miconisargentati]MBW3090445.1 hypothetical protein [Bifidobacterium miconisargentati]
MIIQSSGGVGTVEPAETLTATDVLLLHAKAGLQLISADDAAAVACKALGRDAMTLAQLQADATVLAQVRNSPLAVACIRLSADAAHALGLDETDVTSEQEMTLLATDTDRLMEFCRSGRMLSRMARNPVNKGTLAVIKAINKSQSLLQQVWQTVGGSGWFTSKTTSSQDGVTALNQYCTASTAANCLILVATGYWSSTSQYTNVFVNGEQVSDGQTVNTQQPSSVTKATIGAIALPTATFTETGDGYASIGVFTALNLDDNIWQFPDSTSLTTGGVTFIRSGSSVHVRGTSTSSAWPIYGKSVTLAAGKYHIGLSGATNVKAEIKAGSTSYLNTGASKYEATLTAGTYNLNLFVSPSTSVDETVTPVLAKLS